MNQDMEDTKLELIRYWRLVRSKYLHLIAFVVAVTLLATLIVSLMAPVYKATAVLELKPEQPKAVSSQDMFNINIENSTYFNTQRDIIRSDKIMQKTINELGLDQDPSILLGNPGLLDKFTSLFGQKKPSSKGNIAHVVLFVASKLLTVTTVNGTSLLKVSFRSHSPELAANFANTLTKVYIQDTLESRIKMADQAMLWIRQRADTLKQQLAEAQNRLQEFIRKHHVVMMSGTTASPMSLTNQELVDLTTRKLEARANLDSLEQTYGPLHPKVIAAKAELAKAELALSRGEAHSRALGRTNVELTALQNDVQSTSDLYQSFSNRLKQAAQSSTLQIATARIVDHAVAPLSPTRSKTNLIIVASLMSLVLGIGLIILQDWLNSKIHAVDEIESRLGLPVLGLVPALLFETKAPERNLVLEKMTSSENHQFIESIHTIRTGIMLSAIDNPHKSILVTSSVPGEGKSTFASNLAIAMGNLGRVLLIDADLRKPTVSKYFDTDLAAHGLSEYVAGTAKIEDCIETNTKYGIDIMHAGVRPPDPLQFLSSKRFKSALSRLENKYDRIIVDSAPVQAVSDSLVLSQAVKGIVYVVRANATPDHLIRSCIKRLKQLEAPIIGAVLSQVDTKRAGLYDYGGYYDDYGYSKGDESVSKQENKGPRLKLKRKSRKVEPKVIEAMPEDGTDEHATTDEHAVVEGATEGNGNADEHALEGAIEEILDGNKKA